MMQTHESLSAIVLSLWQPGTASAQLQGTYFKPLNLQHFAGRECYFLVRDTEHADSHWDLILQYDFLKGKKARGYTLHFVLETFFFLCHHRTPSCCTSQNRMLTKHTDFSLPHTARISGLPFQSSLSQALCVHCCEKRQNCVWNGLWV